MPSAIKKDISRSIPVLILAALGCQIASAANAEERGLNELRNTVVNLLQGLVDRGVLTREQAEQMVRAAQEKAAADAAAQAAEEEGAVRVTRVPEIVKEEIRRQVAEDLGAKVTQQVVENAQSEGWGVPAALPDWVRRMRWYGDVRVRAQDDLFASDNVPNSYLNFQTINERGGIGPAGLSAVLNTTEDRRRLRGRLRFGFESVLGWGWTMGAQLTSGNLRDPVSTNQTLGNYAARYQSGIDLAYLQWSGLSSTGRNQFDFSAGRIRNPWVSTDLVFDQDLTFEGASLGTRLGISRMDPTGTYAFATIGAFPLQEVEIEKDKWLLGAQAGLNWKFEGGSRFRAAGAYYDFRNVRGMRNTFGSGLRDFTAPAYVQKGNTMFDIRNDSDPNTALYALAADYRLVDVNAAFDWRLLPGYRLQLSADYVRNIGFDASDVASRVGRPVRGRTKGYQAEVSFGSVDMAQRYAWRASVAYRYLERDAVLDAFTDSDFHLGGTDAKGYVIGADFALTPKVQLRGRYFSASEIDDIPLGIDVLQLDLTAQF